MYRFILICIMCWACAPTQEKAPDRKKTVAELAAEAQKQEILFDSLASANNLTSYLSGSDTVYYHPAQSDRLQFFISKGEKGIYGHLVMSYIGPVSIELNEVTLKSETRNESRFYAASAEKKKEGGVYTETKRVVIDAESVILLKGFEDAPSIEVVFDGQKATDVVTLKGQELTAFQSALEAYILLQK